MWLLGLYTSHISSLPHLLMHCMYTYTIDSLFQKEAIHFAWDLLVRVLKLPKDRLYVTYFEGNTELNIPPDEETKQIWLDIG